MSNQLQYALLNKSNETLNELELNLEKRLQELHPKKIDLSLKRINKLLIKLNNPHKKINNVIFLENASGDDFLNIIRSNFSIKNSLFLDTYKDAFDSDFSKGIIENVSFKKINNDAMDFSGSWVEGKNIYIYGVEDKGISAGENSTIKFTDITVEDSNIAFASKDLSKLVIINGILNRNKIVATAYNKKAEYGPGQMELFDSKLSNNKNAYLVEKNSSIQVDGKEIPISKIKLNKYGVYK